MEASVADPPLDIRDRVIALETELKHTATKAWVLGVVFSGAVLNAGLTVGLLKALGG